MTDTGESPIIVDMLMAPNKFNIYTSYVDMCRCVRYT